MQIFICKKSKLKKENVKTERRLTFEFLRQESRQRYSLRDSISKYYFHLQFRFSKEATKNSPIWFEIYLVEVKLTGRFHQVFLPSYKTWTLLQLHALIFILSHCRLHVFTIWNGYFLKRLNNHIGWAMSNNVSYVMEFLAWWVLKSKVFAQKSTVFKWNCCIL